jgi:hypothetical protein
VNGLDRIAARRVALRFEMRQTRASVCASVQRLRSWFGPAAIAVAGVQALAGRKWLRLAALGMAGAAAVRGLVSAAPRRHQ